MEIIKSQRIQRIHLELIIEDTNRTISSSYITYTPNDEIDDLFLREYNSNNEQSIDRIKRVLSQTFINKYREK